MHDRIGIAEAGAKGIPEIDMGDLFRGQRIHQPELIDIDGHAARGLADAKIIESVKRIGPELDAGTDLAEFRGLLSRMERMPFCARPIAVARPPMPPPAINTGLWSVAAISRICRDVRARLRHAAAHARTRC